MAGANCPLRLCDQGWLVGEKFVELRGRGLCLGQQLCVYEHAAVSQFTTTTSASPIRRYGPDSTYFDPRCLAWDGRAFSWLQVLGMLMQSFSV